MKAVPLPLVAAVFLALLAVGCSSSTTTTTAPTSTTAASTTTVPPTTSVTATDDPADTGAVMFVRTSVPGESLFSAEGEAVDQGLLCDAASGLEVATEDPDGNVLTETQQDALWEGTESFILVTVEEFTCDDASGSFALRLASGVDPTDPDWSPDTAEVTWTITGGAGYETITGEGEDTEFAFVDGEDVVTASGSITSNG